MIILIFTVVLILIVLLIYKLSIYFRKDASRCPNCGSMNYADYYMDDDDNVTFHTTCRNCSKEYSWEFHGIYKKRY